jgi:hypothetical protein
MKLTFEVHGYTITINETEEGVLVSAEKDGEVVEEFELEADTDMEDMEDSDDMDDMDDEDSMEELPEDGEEGQQIQDQEEENDFGGGQKEMEKPMGESKLQSFASFLKKK